MLYASSEQAAQDWIRAIARALLAAKAPAPPPPGVEPPPAPGAKKPRRRSSLGGLKKTTEAARGGSLLEMRGRRAEGLKSSIVVFFRRRETRRRGATERPRRGRPQRTRLRGMCPRREPWTRRDSVSTECVRVESRGRAATPSPRNVSASRAADAPRLRLRGMCPRRGVLLERTELKATPPQVQGAPEPGAGRGRGRRRFGHSRRGGVVAGRPRDRARARDVNARLELRARRDARRGAHGQLLGYGERPRRAQRLGRGRLGRTPADRRDDRPVGPRAAGPHEFVKSGEVAARRSRAGAARGLRAVVASRRGRGRGRGRRGRVGAVFAGGRGLPVRRATRREARGVVRARRDDDVLGRRLEWRLLRVPRRRRGPARIGGRRRMRPRRGRGGGARRGVRDQTSAARRAAETSGERIRLRERRRGGRGRGTPRGRARGGRGGGARGGGLRGRGRRAAEPQAPAAERDPCSFWGWRCAFLEEDGAGGPTPQQLFVSSSSVGTTAEARLSSSRGRLLQQ